jgi:hypothetical protein
MEVDFGDVLRPHEELEYPINLKVFITNYS